MSIQSINPATGEVLENFQETSMSEIDEILEAAETTFREWRHRPFAERTHILRPLEAGARLISIPMVETAETSRRIVEYGKYKPAGNRGFANTSRGMPMSSAIALAPS